MSQATENAKKPSFTKSGPGRYAVQGDGTHANLTIKQKSAGAFGNGLRNSITRKQAARLA